MNILVTGGTGYIGSHTILELLNAEHEIVAVDNLSNSNRESLRRVEEISGKNIVFHNIDIRDKENLEKIFATNKIDAVIHFAGLKAVGESVSKALYYYHNNLVGTLVLLELMEQYEVKNIVFSSSATIYGIPDFSPIKEDAPRSATNPYGQTKLMIEQILEDLAQTNEGWNITSLRYFNPIGAHSSGLIGEDPNGVPNNLFPYITQVAAGKLEKLMIYGDDYETIDGTGVRDYIHVVDLARAHLVALQNEKNPQKYKVFNIGSGKGTSVLEAIQAFEKATKIKIPYEITNRRPGDIATCYADATKASLELGWTTEKSIYDACVDAWNWQKKNPMGYEKIGQV